MQHNLHEAALAATVVANGLYSDVPGNYSEPPLPLTPLSSPISMQPLHLSTRNARFSFANIHANQPRSLDQSSEPSPITTQPNSAQLLVPKTPSILNKIPSIFPFRSNSSISGTRPTTPKSDSEATPALDVPKKSSLSRSMSARYHNESIHPYKLNNLLKMKNDYSDLAQADSVICNKYASLSEECIDVYCRDIVQPDKPDLISPSKLPIPKNSSQVRFQSSLSDMPKLTLSQPIDTRHSNAVSSSLAPSFSAPPPPPPPFTYPSESNRFESSARNLDPGFPLPIYQASYDADQVADGQGNARSLFSQPSTPYYNQFIDKTYDSDEEDSDEEESVKRKNIPITVCLTLVVGYICGGAWFFSNSEEWSFLDASYFCFITLSTIGFGDLVPGRTVLATTPEEGQMTLAICALYLLFGMALLAMSLNLVKEKVIETVRIIGERIGILVNDEDDDFY